MDIERVEAFMKRVEQSEQETFAPVGQKLKVGVDLGTAYIVLVVLDEENNPVACEKQAADVLRDGVVVDYLGALRIVKVLKAKLEKRIGRELVNCAIAMPAGTESSVKTHQYVAEGADLGCIAEAHHYVNSVVTGELPFLLTSCCPAWAMLAKTQFPDFVQEVSQELTPMVATARKIKEAHPEARVVFIGPCAAKKLEASRRTIRSFVDFVLTFEELNGMFAAKEIVPATLEESALDSMRATGAGRGYAVAGGVAAAIERTINEYYPGTDVTVYHAEGLADCKKILLQAKAGKIKNCLIEGMGCPGGCVAGVGTVISPEKAKFFVGSYSEGSEKQVPDKDSLETAERLTKMK